MKLWSLALVLAILLCGCGVITPDVTIPTQPAETTAPTQPTSTQPAPTEESTLPPETEAPGWPEGSVEDQTDGALLSWNLKDSAIDGFCFMGQELLLFYNNGFSTELRLLSTEDMQVKASAKLKGNISYYDAGSWQVTEAGFAYYATSLKKIILLDDQLQEARSVPVPEDIKEKTVISRNLEKAYYLDGWKINSLDLQSGESKLLAEIGETVSGLQLLFDDTVLMYRDPWGKTLFLSAQTGQVIGTGGWIDGIITDEDHYFLAQVTDDHQEYLFGTFGEQPVAFIPDKVFLYSYNGYLPKSNAVVFRNERDTKNTFDYYDLTTGKRIASMSVDLGSVQWCTSMQEDASGEYIWFATKDANYENTKLYRWEVGATTIADDQVYTGNRWTESNPNWEGIAQCRARADAMEEEYGVEILLHTEAKVPYGYGIKYLYQVNIIQDSLDSLEEELASYPEGFFKALGKVSQNGKIQISLARGIVTYSDWEYYDCMQYWQSGNACIVVQCDAYKAGRLVNRGIGFLLEGILEDEGYMEAWEGCNPKGFEYASDPIRYDYLGYEFIDSGSMQSRSYDVAALFEYAMMNGTGNHFNGEGIQKKLAVLCRCLREAFDLNRDALLPWEQYLSTT